MAIESSTCVTRSPRRWHRGLLPAAVLVAATLAAPGAQAQDSLRIGIVTFLSGGAAGPFGVPARNAAEVVIEGLNGKKLPAPYDSAGIGGLKIVPVFIDEAGTQVVADYRRLVEKEQVDLVIGYISSGNCKAVAPVVEELRKMTVFFDCGTPQIFEDVVTDPKYLLRTGAHATMDSVGAARYLLENSPDVKSITGINQNYAWGQDSWQDFAAAIKALKPALEHKAPQFPKLFAGQFGTEITALLAAKPDAIHSSFWGGDMEAFVLQASGRGLFQRAKVVLTTGETAMYRLRGQMPNGTIIGGRGPHGDFAPKSALNDWFRAQYFDRFATPPTYPSYKMALALLGVKSAYEKAAKAAGGKPTQEQVIAAFRGLEYESPSGKVRMALSKGHQAIQDTAYGEYVFDKDSGQPKLAKVKVYAAECVNPPDGVKSLDWINGGFKGAKCN
jgi:branched-chain amino acid transport system substrate-binding protein